MVRIEELLSVELENLFSYYTGEQAPTEFNLRLPPNSSRQKVAIIMGRNGYGKTSFLNALRLLFLGTDSDEARRLIARWPQWKAPLLREQFLFGLSGEWEGIFNTRASAERKLQRASVKITWREQAGTGWAIRRWEGINPGAKQCREALEVRLPREKTSRTGEQATLALEERLPARFVQFYIFDGEAMQNIAASLGETVKTSDQSVQVERMLGIEKFYQLVNLLEEKRQNIGKSARVKAHQDKYNEAIRKLQELKEEEQSQNNRRGALIAEISTLQTALDHAQAQIAKLNIDEHSRKRQHEIQIRLKGISSELAQLWDALLNTHFSNLSLIAHPELVDAAIGRLEDLASRGSTDSADEIQDQLLVELLGELPSLLFDKLYQPRPPLTSGQENFFKAKLNDLLTKKRPKREQEQVFFRSIGADDKNQSLKILRSYSTHSNMREKYRAALVRWNELEQEGTTIQKELAALESQGVGDLDEYDRLIKKRAEVDQLLRQAQAELASCKAPKDLARNVKAQQSLVDQALADLREAYAKEAQRDHAFSWINFLRDYRSIFAQKQFGKLGERMNEHWQELMTSQRQIESITCDNQLRIRFWIGSGQAIGMNSLSEGMKQLAATAFLWALLDITERRFPVIIDTPLGRIDYGHQKQLLEKFYPNIGQVIMLPTDSELDANKYKLLERFTYKRYTLINNGTSGTTFQ